MTPSEASPHIPVEAVAFLAELAANNNVDWFAANKQRYERVVRQPLARLTEVLSPVMAGVDPLLQRHPGAVISRIRRDVRFSRDKSPFRSTQWLAFKRRSAEWTARPAFFMEFGPELFHHGMGFYAAGTRAMAALRDLALERPGEYCAAMESAAQAGYALQGETYKRPKPALDQPQPVQELFRMRNVYMVRTGAPGEAVDNPALAGLLAAGFTALAPLYRIWLQAAEAAAGRS